MPGPGRPFQKGVSGNPKGRPPSTHALAEHIRRACDPADLARIALEMALDASLEPKDRIAALKFLADHGWSKPLAQIEIATGRPLDLSNLTDEQLATLAALDADAAPTDGEAQ